MHAPSWHNWPSTHVPGLHLVRHFPLAQICPQAHSESIEHVSAQYCPDSSHGQPELQRCNGSEQLNNGFPRKPLGQLHWTAWLITKHSEHWPHCPDVVHGSWHLLLMHASVPKQLKSLRHPTWHNRFSQIWPFPQAASVLQIDLHVPRTHRSSAKQFWSLLQFAWQTFAKHEWFGGHSLWVEHEVGAYLQPKFGSPTK